jgi:FHS family Na+ dependent glucose MFS transporter 1
MNFSLPQNLEDKRWKLAATGLYSASFAALGLTFSILGPTLPALAQQTHSSLTDISVLFIARSVGSLVGSVGGGRMFDRFAGHRVVAAVLVLMALVTALVPVMPQLWLLTLILFISGVVHGTLNVGGNALLIWAHGKGVAPYMNALHFFFGLGTFLTPILVAQVVLLTGGMAWAYGLVAVTFVPVAVFALFLRSPQPQKASAAPGQGKADPWLVLGFFLIFFGYAGASGAHGGWIFTYVTRLGLANETVAAYLNSAFWGALTAGRLLSIPFAVRFTPKAMLRLDLLGSLLSLGLMAVFPHSLLALGLGSAGLGFFQATIFPTNMSLASRHIPITGKVTGWLSIGSSLGALVLPWLVGQLFETVGPEMLIYLNFGNVLLTLGVFFWLTKRLEIESP